MSKFNAEYICPSIFSYPNFDKLLESRKDAKSSWMFRDKTERTKEGILKEIYDKQRNLFLSEPGYGKTRLLWEIQKDLTKSGNKVIFTELKYFTHEKSLEIYTIEQARLQGILLSSLTDDLVLCYDAIDEVAQDSFFELIRQMKLLFEKYKNIKIILSCRLLFYQKYPVFNGYGFNYVFLDNFDFDDVRQYLRSVLNEKKVRVFSDSQIDSIVNDFKEPNWESIILIPRYIEKFVEFRLFNPNQKPTRSSLYNFFVNERLMVEDSKRGAQDGVIIRRILEKIALVLEIYQKNEISKDELITIMEDIESHITGNFLDMGKMKILFEHSLWKDDGKSISFEDHTLQEYLASCELIRLGGQRFLYDFVVDLQLNEIHPSWFGTLGFCVDQNINLLEPLIDFGQIDKERIIGSEEYHSFLTKVDVSKLSYDQKISIFRKVFGQYQNERIWIDWEIARRLAMFFELSLNNYLKSWIKDNSLEKTPEMGKYVPKGNVAQILGFILQQGIMDEDRKIFWKKKLIEFANDENENGVLQRQALFALESFADEKDIPMVRKSFLHPSELVRDRFIDFCANVAPNNQLSIKFFIEGIKQESIHANLALVKVTDKDALKFLFDNLCSDLQFLKTILTHEKIYLKDNKNIFKNIENIYDDKFKELLLQIILKSIGLYKYDSLIVKNAAAILKKNKPDIILEVCDILLVNDEYKKHLFDFEVLFSMLLTKDTLKKAIDKLNVLQNSAWIIFGALQMAKVKNMLGADELYEEGRGYLPEIYKKVEDENVKRPNVLSEEKAYEKFLSKLKPEEGKYRTDVFRYFSEKYDILKPFLNKNDISYIENLAKKLLKQINPQKTEFKILQWDKEKKNITQYQMNSAVVIFEDCLEVARTLELKIDGEMRKNIIDFIPFTEQDSLDNIMALLPDIKASELDNVLKIYNSNAEKKYFMPHNFIKIVKEFKLTNAISVLKSFVSDKKFPDYERKEALKCIGDLETDSKYFKKVFKENLKNNPKLAATANQILIEKFYDKKAVKWRIEKVKEKQIKFIEPKGGHFVSDIENEFHEKEFASPLLKLASKEFISEFISLLAYSLELLEKDKGYWSYVRYIWEIVVGYVDGLRLDGNYEPIIKLEKFVLENAGKEGINWFGIRLKELKRKYQVYIGVPKNVNDCIRIYKDIKTRQYSGIASLREMKEKIKNIIDKDIRSWVEVQGIKDIICRDKQKSVDEIEIQKLLFIPLKTSLEKLGITVLREPQKIDGEKVDFYISYGFSPNMIMVIEVKRSEHGDIKYKSNLSKKESFKKFKRYIEGFSARYGFFLVFNVHCDTKKWENLLVNVKKYYSKIRNVDIIGIDAFNP